MNLLFYRAQVLKMNNIKKHLPLLLIVVIAFALRLVNIGYSDYQGDEIKALFIPDPGQNVSAFLLDQRKGPLQFIVTYLLKFVNPTYTNEFLVRLPFALAGAFAVFFFYKLNRTYFGQKIAFFASFFFATNGFFVALSRIVQYQSFVMLFIVLTLYFFTLALTSEKWKIKGLYFGFASWALAILAHYDGVFIAPFAFYILFRWFKENRTLLKHLVASMIVSGLMLAAFYIPFILTLSQATLDYWGNRLDGGQGKISSSRYLFQVYNPIYTIHIYNLLSIFGFTALKKKNTALIFVTLWFLVPFIFFEAIVNIPGTHIFNYILPVTVIMAFGITQLELVTEWLFNKLKLSEGVASKISAFGIASIFAFIFLQSYFVYVDHDVEYPWTNEKFFVWEFHRPSAIFHLSMFGFPYFRNWENIQNFVVNDSAVLPCKPGKNDCYAKVTKKTEFYSTNERETISRYYIPFEKDSDNAGYYVFIDNPQSFTPQILNDKAEYWAQKYNPIYTFTSGTNELVKVYYMPSGKLDEIILQGY